MSCAVFDEPVGRLKIKSTGRAGQNKINEYETETFFGGAQTTCSR